MRMTSLMWPPCRWIKTLFLLIMFACCVASSATFAQDKQDTEEPADDSEQVNATAVFAEAYRLSKSAQTAADYSKLIELCEKALEANPDQKQVEYADKLMSWSYNRRGEFLADEKQLEEAFADFDRAIELDPTRWQAWHNRGVNYAFNRDYDNAMADFRKTIELHPAYANAHFNLGELLYTRGDLEAAIEAYDEAIRLNPRDATALNSRGHAYFVLATREENVSRRQRDYAAAQRDYTEAIRIKPDYAAAYTNRGDVYYDLGSFARAGEDYRRAVDLDDTLGRAYQSAAWLMATCPDDSIRNEQLAIQAARRAIAIDGESDHTYLETLAAAYANAGQFEEAAAIQSRAIRIAPADRMEQQQERLRMFQQGQPYRTEDPRASRQNARRRNRTRG